MKTLAEALQEQITRNEELIKQYDEVGGVEVTFAKMMIGRDVDNAKVILAGGISSAVIRGASGYEEEITSCELLVVTENTTWTLK